MSHSITSLPPQIWSQLALACRDRQHGWRTPVLASTDLQGFPTARTVVLREADAPLQQLVFFTDQRSPKVHELQRQPRAMLVFWCAKLSWQLRVQVQVDVLSTGSLLEQAWNRLQHSATAADYLQTQAPGSVLVPVNGDTVVGSHHLCLLVAAVHQMDWLELSPQGHQRVLFSQNNVQSLVP